MKKITFINFAKFNQENWTISKFWGDNGYLGFDLSPKGRNQVLFGFLHRGGGPFGKK